MRNNSKEKNDENRFANQSSEIIVLNNEARDNLMKAIKSPPKANDSLRGLLSNK